jgi:hypothetical protein
MRVSLTGGAYTARSVIASAQRAVNLIAEPIPGAQGEPAQMVHFPTPGLASWGTVGSGPIRAIRQASNGTAYCVSGSGVYSFFPASKLGDITPGLHGPCSLTDNGLDLVIVDGTSAGWTVNLASGAFAPIADPGAVFSGGTRADYADTYFVFNRPNTPQFYLSDSLATTFDPLWFANKEATADNLVAAVVAKREIWLLGERSSEIWSDTGAADFPFAIVPNVLIPHGCVAKYSPVEVDNAVLWLSRDRNGQGIVVSGAGYEAKRVSTYAIEAEFTTYARIDDAIGWSYQMAGHQYYALSFPTADKTWCFDITTGLWHEWLWIDSNGTEHRHRGMCAYNINGVVMVGDWQNGNIYSLDSAVGTDNGNPIKRERSAPHLLADGRRVFYRQVIADIETGTGGNLLPEPPQISLSWSDDRGHNWGSPVLQSMGASGEYLKSLQWQRLGLARDRVFRIQWSTPYQTALQGFWVDAHPADS